MRRVECSQDEEQRVAERRAADRIPEWAAARPSPQRDPLPEGQPAVRGHPSQEVRAERPHQCARACGRAWRLCLCAHSPPQSPSPSAPALLSTPSSSLLSSPISDCPLFLALHSCALPPLIADVKHSLLTQHGGLRLRPHALNPSLSHHQLQIIGTRTSRFSLRTAMSLEAFQQFLMSDANSVVNIEALDVTEDMEQPLGHYCTCDKILLDK